MRFVAPWAPLRNTYCAPAAKTDHSDAEHGGLRPRRLTSSADALAHVRGHGEGLTAVLIYGRSSRLEVGRFAAGLVEALSEGIHFAKKAQRRLL